MSMSPFFALTATPSISMLTRSSAMNAVFRAVCRLGRPRAQGLGDDAPAAVIDHVLELVPVVLEEALHRPCRRVPEGADGVSLDAVRDIEQQAQLVAARLAGQHPLEQAVHPAGALAAGRALAAGLRVVEA